MVTRPDPSSTATDLGHEVNVGGVRRDRYREFFRHDPWQIALVSWSVVRGSGIHPIDQWWRPGMVCLQGACKLDEYEKL